MGVDAGEFLFIELFMLDLQAEFREPWAAELATLGAGAREIDQQRERFALGLAANQGQALIQTTLNRVERTGSEHPSLSKCVGRAFELISLQGNLPRFDGRVGAGITAGFLRA